MHLNPAMISDDAIEDIKLKNEFIRINSNLKNVLHSVNFCGICLDTTQEMFHMENFLSFNEDFKSCTTQQMVWELFEKTEASNFPSKYVCDVCCNELIQAYMFMVKARNSSKILNSYLDQINSQLDDVETMVRKTNKTDVENAIITLRDKFSSQITPKQELTDTSDDNNWSGYESDDDEYICCHCSKTFTNKKSLLVHSKLHHFKKTRAKCTECMADHCAHKKYLDDINKQKKKGSSILRCLDCDYTCAKKNGLISHVNKEHLKLFTHLCESCGQNFHSKLLLYHHTKKYHSREYICEYCDLQFNDNPSLAQHTVECRSVEREFMCAECPASFDTIQKLNKHLEKHKKISCSLCSKKVKNEHFLKRHMHYAHMTNYVKVKKDPQERDNRPRLCSVCPAILHSLTELKDHLNSHDPTEKHHCHVCKKQFNTRKEYNIHVSSLTHARRVNPNAEFNFKCTDCIFTSKSKAMMENHQNTFHLKVKPYQCQICSKKFTTQLNLKYHEDRHTGVKRFQCSLCSNLFTTAQGLKKHILRHHSEKRPIPCESCDKTFVCQSELNLHKQRNHAEKSIPCPLCGVKFSSRANLRAHIFKVHFKSKEQFEEFMTSKNVSKEFYEMFRDHRLNF